MESLISLYLPSEPINHSTSSGCAPRLRYKESHLQGPCFESISWGEKSGVSYNFTKFNIPRCCFSWELQDLPTFMVENLWFSCSFGTFIYLHSISVHLGYTKFQGGCCHLKRNFGEFILLNLHFSWTFWGCKTHIPYHPWDDCIFPCMNTIKIKHPCR